MSERAKRADVFDIDGVLVRRSPVQGGALWDYVRFWSYNKHNRLYVPKHAVTNEDRVILDAPLGLTERVDFIRHERRKVKKGIREVFESAPGDIFIATGRSSKQEWVDMTDRVFRDGRIDQYPKHIYFTPPGVSSDDNKFSALSELQWGYEEIWYYDDNARTIKRFAPLFPGINFVIVEDLTSGLLFWERERRKYPNVYRIGMKLAA